jgi:hypothetical protein
MTEINSPTVPVDDTAPLPSTAKAAQPDDALMSLFNTAESRLDKVLGKTTTQRMQRVGVFAAVIAMAAGVIAYRRMHRL